MLLKIILSLALQLLFTAPADSTTITHRVQHDKSTIKTNDQLPLQQHSNKRRRNLQAWNQNNYGCNPGHCYVPRYQQCFHLTSYECNAAKTPGTPPPTSRPSVTPLVTSIHPIQLILKNVNDDYILSAEVRSTLLRLVSELLTENLAAIEGLDLVKVEYAGRLRQKNERRLQMLVESSSSGGGLRHNNKHRLLLKSISVPLQITVMGTTDISDFALSYLMEIIRSNVLSRLVTYLRENANLTGSTVVMTADTFDFTDLLTGSTNPPTGKPTPMPINQKDGVQTLTMEEDNGSGGGMLWWIWLIIVLAILSLLLCICIYCSKRCKSKSEGKQQQAMYTWMKTGSTGSSYSTSTNPQSVSMSQQQRRRYDYDNEDELFLGQAMNVRRKNRSNESRYYDEERRRPDQKRSRQQKHQPRKQRSGKPMKKRRDDRERSKKKKRRKPQARDEDLQVEYGDYDDRPPHQGALVLYDTNDTNANRGGALVSYDANQSYGTKEPEGRVAAKMKSMYAAEAYAIESLANNTRQTEEPEGKNADDVYSVIHANHDDTKNIKMITTPQNHDNETDEPSMMTNHNDC